MSWCGLQITNPNTKYKFKKPKRKLQNKIQKKTKVKNHKLSISKDCFLATWNVFLVKLDKTLHKISPYFWKLNNFWQVYEGLSPENYKKTSKIMFLVPFQSWSYPLTLVNKSSIFWITKMRISLEPLVQI